MIRFVVLIFLTKFVIVYSIPALYSLQITPNVSSPIFSSSETPEVSSPNFSTSKASNVSSPIFSSSEAPKILSPICSTSKASNVWPPIFNTSEDSNDSSPESEEDSDLGEPLFLTPLIEAGNLSEAQRLARVHFAEHLNITSYSGFLTVNKTYDSNHFFWYFPPTKADSKTAPVVLWLQGGPGVSSVIGILKENSPISSNDGKIFEIREHHWAIDHHLIYIDNPVGAGFSFTKNESGYCEDEVRVGEELYSSVVQFLQLFPDLQQNEFYITGESYAGKYIPALGYTIHNKNPNAKLKVNLKGMAIGNGLCDPEHQIGFGEYAYQAGLIDYKEKENSKYYEDLAVKNIKEKKWNEAYEYYRCSKHNADVKIGLSSLNFVTDEQGSLQYYSWNISMNSELRRGIHVGNLSFSKNSRHVRAKLSKDLMQSVAPWISELLNHYRILFYNGQFDLQVPYPSTVNFLRHLNFSSAGEYRKANRCIWKVDNDVAGYVKTAGNLTEVLVRNAGHLVPKDKPKWALDMIKKFTHPTQSDVNKDAH